MEAVMEIAVTEAYICLRRAVPAKEQLRPHTGSKLSPGTQEEVYMASGEALQELTAKPMARKCRIFEQEIKPDSPITSTNGSTSLL